MLKTLFETSITCIAMGVVLFCIAAVLKMFSGTIISEKRFTHDELGIPDEPIKISIPVRDNANNYTVSAQHVNVDVHQLTLNAITAATGNNHHRSRNRLYELNYDIKALQGKTLKYHKNGDTKHGMKMPSFIRDIRFLQIGSLGRNELAFINMKKVGEIDMIEMRLSAYGDRKGYVNLEVKEDAIILPDTVRLFTKVLFFGGLLLFLVNPNFWRNVTFKYKN